MKSSRKPVVAEAAHAPLNEIIRSNGGGAIRTIVDGRRTIPTGKFISVKADFRSLPWESKKGELPVLQLCEISPRVKFMLSQPHTLKLHVAGLSRPLYYTPDVEADVHPSLIRDLRRGVPFGEAALATVASKCRSRTRKLVLEVKTEDDPRLDDPEYTEKLRLARDLYSHHGYEFVVVHKQDDIDDIDLAAVERIVLDNLVGVRPTHLAAVRALFRKVGGAVPYYLLADALGGGPAGRAVLHAMLIRGHVCLDFSSAFGPSSPVHLIGNALGT